MMKATKKLLTLLATAITKLTLAKEIQEFPREIHGNKGDKIQLNVNHFFHDIRRMSITKPPELAGMIKVKKHFQEDWRQSKTFKNIRITKHVNTLKFYENKAISIIDNQHLVQYPINGHHFIENLKENDVKIKLLESQNEEALDKYFKLSCGDSQTLGNREFVSCIGLGIFRSPTVDYRYQKFSVLVVINLDSFDFKIILVGKLDTISPRFRIVVDRWGSDKEDIYTAVVVGGDGSAKAYRVNVSDETRFAQEIFSFKEFVNQMREGKVIQWTSAKFMKKGFFTDVSTSVLALSGYQKYYQGAQESYHPVIYCVKMVQEGKYEVFKQRSNQVNISQKDYLTASFDVFENEKYRNSRIGYSLNIATRHKFIEIGLQSQGSFFLFFKPIYCSSSGTSSSYALPVVDVKNNFYIISYKEANNRKYSRGISILDRKVLVGGEFIDGDYTAVSILTEKKKYDTRHFILLARYNSDMELYFMDPNRTIIFDLTGGELPNKTYPLNFTIEDHRGSTFVRPFNLSFTIDGELELDRSVYRVQRTEVVRMKIGSENSKIKFLSLDGFMGSVQCGLGLHLNQAENSVINLNKDMRNKQIDDVLPIDDDYYFLAYKNAYQGSNGSKHQLYLLRCDIDISGFLKNECKLAGTNEIDSHFIIRHSFSVSNFIGIVVVDYNQMKAKVMVYDRNLNEKPKMHFNISKEYLLTDFTINTFDSQNSLEIYSILKSFPIAKTTVSYEEVYFDPNSNTTQVQPPRFFYATNETISKIYYDPDSPHVSLSLLFERKEGNSTMKSGNRYFLALEYKRKYADNFEILSHKVYEPQTGVPNAVMCMGKEMLVYHDKSQGVNRIIGEPKNREYIGSSFKYDLGIGSYVIGSKCFPNLKTFQILVQNFSGEKFFVNLRMKISLDSRERYHSYKKVSKDVIFFHSYHEIGKEFITTTFKKRNAKLGDQLMIMFTYFNGPDFEIDTSKVGFSGKGETKEIKIVAKNNEGVTKNGSVMVKEVVVPPSEMKIKKNFPPKNYVLEPNETLTISNISDINGPVIDIKLKAPDNFTNGKNYTFHGRKPLVFGYFNQSYYEIRRVEIEDNKLIALVYNKKKSLTFIQIIDNPDNFTRGKESSPVRFPFDKKLEGKIVYNSFNFVKKEQNDTNGVQDFLIVSYQSHITYGYSLELYKLVGGKWKMLVEVPLEKQQLSENFELDLVGEEEIRLFTYEGDNLIVFRIKKDGVKGNWVKMSGIQVIKLSQNVKFWSMRTINIESNHTNSTTNVTRKVQSGVVFFYADSDSSKISSIWVRHERDSKNQIEFWNFKDFEIYKKSNDSSLGKSDLLNCDIDKKESKVFTRGEEELRCFASFSGAMDYVLVYRLNLARALSQNNSEIFQSVKEELTILSIKGFESKEVTKSDRFLAVKMKNLKNYNRVNQFSECPYIIGVYKLDSNYSYAAIDCRELGDIDKFFEPQFSISGNEESQIIYVSSIRNAVISPQDQRLLVESKQKFLNKLGQKSAGLLAFGIKKAELVIINAFQISTFSLFVETEDGEMRPSSVMKSLVNVFKLPLRIEMNLNSGLWFICVTVALGLVAIFGLKCIATSGIKEVIFGYKIKPSSKQGEMQSNINHNNQRGLRSIEESQII